MSQVKMRLFWFLAITCLHAKPMVYDCFLFFNELEILDIRLHEMADVVDKFVLVESVETFRGAPKPLFYTENKARFAKFADKIIHVVLHDRLQTGDPWRREITQRDNILLGLTNCKDDDIILISDVDEIVEHTGVLAMVKAIREEGQLAVGANQRYHSNLLNSYTDGIPWRGTIASTYAYVKERTPQALREMRGKVPPVAKGWHFTWQGGIEKVLYKMASYSHWESDTEQDRIRTRRDYETRHLCPVIPIDDTFPLYVQQNQGYLESIGYIIQPQSSPPNEVGESP